MDPCISPWLLGAMTSVVLPQISLSWCYYGELKLLLHQWFWGNGVKFSPLYFCKVHLSVEVRILMDWSLAYRNVLIFSCLDGRITLWYSLNLLKMLVRWKWML